MASAQVGYSGRSKNCHSHFKLIPYSLSMLLQACDVVIILSSYVSFSLPPSPFAVRINHLPSITFFKVFSYFFSSGFGKKTNRYLDSHFFFLSSFFLINGQIFLWPGNLGEFLPSCFSGKKVRPSQTSQRSSLFRNFRPFQHSCCF